MISWRMSLYFPNPTLTMTYFCFSILTLLTTPLEELPSGCSIEPVRVANALSNLSASLEYQARLVDLFHSDVLEIEMQLLNNIYSHTIRQSRLVDLEMEILSFSPVPILQEEEAEQAAQVLNDLGLTLFTLRDLLRAVDYWIQQTTLNAHQLILHSSSTPMFAVEVSRLSYILGLFTDDD